MPKNASGVFINSNIGGNIHGLVLNHGSAFVFPWCDEQLAEVPKPGKTPIAFFCVESVLGSCKSTSARPQLGDILSFLTVM